ncbi:apolipoprotein D-like [Neocloeon triangulifer]|uniref:apolipoprotein D-like n=1 Tax=Neocloeon triangulifer TaxID=2078957 RepID=UPI00286F068A|nr:apolipoprotein D-like [Neocloeon triangulifer]
MYQSLPANLGQSSFAGDWYVLAYKGDPALPEKKCAKIKVEVGQQDGRTTIVYKFHYQQADGDKTAEFFTQALRPTDPSTGFGVFVKTNYWESLTKTGIVATDYENFALVMACGPLFDIQRRSFGRQIYANILGRGVDSIPPATMTALKNVLSSYDIDLDTLRHVDNSSC